MKKRYENIGSKSQNFKSFSCFIPKFTNIHIQPPETEGLVALQTVDAANANCYNKITAHRIEGVDGG